MKNLFKRAWNYHFFFFPYTLLLRKYCKGSWVPECLDSELGQGTEREEERSQALSLNYFKEENKELSVMQKQHKKILCIPPKPVLFLSCFLLKSLCIGTFLPHLALSDIALHVSTLACQLERLPLEGLLLPPPVQALLAGSTVAHIQRLCFCFYCHLSPVCPFKPSSHCWLVLCALLLGPLLILCHSYLILSLFRFAPTVVSPRDDRTLSSPLEEKVNSSTPLSTTSLPNKNLTLFHKHEFCLLAFSFSASWDSESKDLWIKHRFQFHNVRVSPCSFMRMRRDILSSLTLPEEALDQVP